MPPNAVYYVGWASPATLPLMGIRPPCMRCVRLPGEPIDVFPSSPPTRTTRVALWDDNQGLCGWSSAACAPTCDPACLPQIDYTAPRWAGSLHWRPPACFISMRPAAPSPCTRHLCSAPGACAFARSPATALRIRARGAPGSASDAPLTPADLKGGYPCQIPHRVRQRMQAPRLLAHRVARRHSAQAPRSALPLAAA